EQAVETLVLDFAGVDGHLAVVGAPQTGKSTLLRTLVTACALMYSPVAAQFYAIDYGGGALQTLEALPPLGSVCGPFVPGGSPRVIRELHSLLDRRERFFRSTGAESMAAFRRIRDAVGAEGQVCADVFLVIDNWAAVRQDFEDLEPELLDIAARGPGLGVHLV